MKRFLLAAAFAFVVLLPGISPGSTVSAESGCWTDLGSYVQWSSNPDQMTAWLNFDCATGDTGNRVVQACIQHSQNMATEGCVTNYTWAAYGGAQSYYVYRWYGGDSIRGWTYFRGEDGSVTVKVTAWY